MSKKIALALVCSLLLSLLLSSMSVLAYAEGSDGDGSDELSPFWSALLVGAVFSLIIVLVMKSTMKKTKGTGAAGEYLDRASVEINHTRDRFMYSTLTKVKKPENNNNKR